MPRKFRETDVTSLFKGTFTDPKKLREADVTSQFKGTFTDPRKLGETDVTSLFKGAFTRLENSEKLMSHLCLKGHLLTLKN